MQQSRCHIPFMFTFLVLLGSILCFKEVSPTENLCSNVGLCCKHRDSDCVVQHVFPNSSVDTSALPCYCDHACLNLDDCCPDYQDFCSVEHCEVSEWGPWTPCPIPDADGWESDEGKRKEDCDGGGDQDAEHIYITERRRIILRHPSNGGKKCPDLVERKPCPGAKKDGGRKCSNQIPTEDKNLNLHPHTGQKSPEISEHCIETRVKKISRGCRRKVNISVGEKMCVHCPISTNHLEESRNSETCQKMLNFVRKRFRLNRHCFGKLERSSHDDNELQYKCSCSPQDLQYRLVT